ncbi:hypothetical protein L6270_01050 [Candidatus Parcubacteria bacterium]|nr:hypothetical protein [Patescibacteria group bacterium]MBU4309733.1 hypothetical protein [Patescibacteria group bacterium]MBU4432119.1 hypothetical protein [Patescibacteria group bacterium]MBU4577879.1 hypothetical protein [Patescibacteria group bacterium]MCG2696610.1 hypothetical protein [Candidatus Parcubacteria bacterium]
MKIIGNIFKTIKCQVRKKLLQWEETYPRFSEFQDKRRYKKFDKPNDNHGINSHTNPHLYQLLIDYRNVHCLTNRELGNLLLTFYPEKFNLISNEEINDFNSGINFIYMNEDVERLRAETATLYEQNKLKYAGACFSFKIFDNIVSEIKPRNNNESRDSIRNIKKMFCELRRLLNKHIAEPDSTK